MGKSTTLISYCTQWSRMGRHPHQEISESQARARHERGELYTAVLGDDVGPVCFLEFSAFRSVAVEFLDRALRTYRCYSFQEKKPNLLFLSMASDAEFPNEVDDPDRAIVYYFETTGDVAIVRYESQANGIGSRMLGREERQVDVTNNWEPFPEFGQYDGLATRDRGIPALQRS